MPLLSDVGVIFLSSIIVLTLNGQFLDCATIAFSEWYNTAKSHIWIYPSWTLLRYHPPLSTVTTLLIAVHNCICITKS